MLLEHLILKQMINIALNKEPNELYVTFLYFKLSLFLFLLTSHNYSCSFSLNSLSVGIAVLIEYSVFSLLVYWIFASDVDMHETANLIHSNSHFNPEDRPVITWGQWVRNVFNIMDLFHNLSPSGDSSLTTKLNPDEVRSIKVLFL